MPVLIDLDRALGRSERDGGKTGSSGPAGGAGSPPPRCGPVRQTSCSQMERDERAQEEPRAGLPLLWVVAIFLASGEAAWWFLWHVLGT